MRARLVAYAAQGDGVGGELAADVVLEGGFEVSKGGGGGDAVEDAVVAEKGDDGLAAFVERTVGEAGGEQAGMASVERLLAGEGGDAEGSESRRRSLAATKSKFHQRTSRRRAAGKRLNWICLLKAVSRGCS